MPLALLQEHDPDMDEDELECILAQLISKSLIRGFLSHEQKVLVTAKVIE